jgi:hypothetical protein
MLYLSTYVPLYLTQGCTPLQNMKSSNIPVPAISTHHLLSRSRRDNGQRLLHEHASLRRDKPGSAGASVSKTHKALQINPLHALVLAAPVMQHRIQCYHYPRPATWVALLLHFRISPKSRIVLREDLLRCHNSGLVLYPVAKRASTEGKKYGQSEYLDHRAVSR